MRQFPKYSLQTHFMSHAQCTWLDRISSSTSAQHSVPQSTSLHVYWTKKRWIFRNTSLALHVDGRPCLANVAQGSLFYEESDQNWYPSDHGAFLQSIQGVQGGPEMCPVHRGVREPTGSHFCQTSPCVCGMTRLGMHQYRGTVVCFSVRVSGYTREALLCFVLCTRLRGRLCGCGNPGADGRPISCQSALHYVFGAAVLRKMVQRCTTAVRYPCASRFMAQSHLGSVMIRPCGSQLGTD